MTEALLANLQARANARGLVLASEAALLRDLGIDNTTLRQGLARLEAAGLIEVVSPPPFLVARLRPAWSGRKSHHPETPAKTAASVNRAYSIQSSLSESQLLTRESYRRPAEDEALLREILETLGEADPTTFRGAIKNYPAGVIRTALTRIRRMKNVRKSRTALFRFLLPRIAKETPSIK